MEALQVKKSLNYDIKSNPIILRRNHSLTMKAYSTNSVSSFLQKIHIIFQKLDSLNNEYISRRW